MFRCFQIVLFFLGVLTCVAKKPVPPSCNQEPLEAETVASPTSDTVRDGELAQLKALLAEHRKNVGRYIFLHRCLHRPLSAPRLRCTKTPSVRLVANSETVIFVTLTPPAERRPPKKNQNCRRPVRSMASPLAGNNTLQETPVSLWAILEND